MKSSSAAVFCVDFESLPKVCQMHDVPHYRCIMNLVMSTLNYICAAPALPPHRLNPRLINIEGNGGSNNVLLTVHALLLRGGLAPCIPASQTHTHVPQCDSVGKKKKKRITQHCWSELLSLPALHSGPLTEAVMFEMQGALSLSITD